MGKHFAAIQLELEAEQETRRYRTALLRFLLEQAESASTDAEWAGRILDDGAYDEVWRILKWAENDLPSMVTCMAIHIRLEKLQRTKRGAK